MIDFRKPQQGATGTAAVPGFLTNENTSAVSYNYISEILVYTGIGGETEGYTVRKRIGLTKCSTDSGSV